MKIVYRTLLLIGVGIIGFALLANHFGFDKDNNWGTGRIIILLLGFFIFLLGMLIISWDLLVKVFIKIDGGLKEFTNAIKSIPAIRSSLLQYSNLSKRIENHPVMKWYAAKISTPLKHSRIARYFEGSNYRKAGVTAAILGCVVITIYIWLVSVGQWTKWPSTGDYYYELADAFWHGQLNLLIKPDPALLALPDPYDSESHVHISHPWDVLLFNGKFYLYWGPAPAVILAAVRLFYAGNIGDQILVFSFVSGAFIFTVLLILQIYNRLFSNLGWGIVVPGILMAGFANPIPWILNRPGIYEASIAGGQFFLIGGLFFGFLAIEKEKSRLFYLILASFCWVSVLASRVSLVGAVAFLLVMMSGLLFYISKGYKAWFYSLSAISIPFIIGSLGLGLYNKSRFGSWFEVGTRYQLGNQNLNKIHDQVLSIANILPNLHNYLINPFRTISVFPYIKPNWGGKYIFFQINTPPNYYTEQITGLLPSVPYVILALIPVIYIFWKGWQFTKTFGLKQVPPLSTNPETKVIWWAAALSGATLLVFSTTLLLIWATMRYMVDVIFLATLTSTLGFFIGLIYLGNYPGWRKLFVVFVIVITVASIIISLLLAITGYDSRFEKLNPALFEFLTRLLTP